LFPEPTDLDALLENGLLQRVGCQFHWQNPGYRDFNDFLDTMTSKKRKNIKRERRLVEQANIRLRILHGHEASSEEWDRFYQFYCATFQHRWGFPYLTRSFFQAIADTLGQQIVLILANDGQQDVAGALCLQSADTLYGRYWGCSLEFDSLHFETCYYQGIDYCIRNGLRLFEPGAQGEHKISRGFLPTLTYSAHWLAHPAFNAAIADFLRRETPAVEAYARSLQQHSPYRDAMTNA
jgi:hypothetical protein